jgi:hypothetical protein
MKWVEDNLFIVIFIFQMFDDISNYHIEGDMNIPSTSKTNNVPGSADFNTLDEPIKETIVSY